MCSCHALFLGESKPAVYRCFHLKHLLVLFSRRSVSLELCVLASILGQTSSCVSPAERSSCANRTVELSPCPKAALASALISTGASLVPCSTSPRGTAPGASLAGLPGEISSVSCCALVSHANEARFRLLFGLGELCFGNTCVRAGLERALAAEAYWGLSRACVLRPYGRAFKTIIICLLQLCNFLFPFVHAFF